LCITANLDADGSIRVIYGRGGQSRTVIHVRFAFESEQIADILEGPLCANSDLTHRSEKLVGHLVGTAERPRFR
jgi:hypothetical protein